MNNEARREGSRRHLLSALLVPERPACSVAAAALLMRVVASHGGEAGRKAVRSSGGVEALQGAAAAVAPSQARQTSARKPVPEGAVSSHAFAPALP